MCTFCLRRRVYHKEAEIYLWHYAPIYSRNERGTKRRANGTKRLAITNVFVPFARIYSAPDLSPRQRAWTIATEKQNDNIYSINARWKRRVALSRLPRLFNARLVPERFGRIFQASLVALSPSVSIDPIRKKSHAHLFDIDINAYTASIWMYGTCSKPRVIDSRSQE